jgi:hypothetical protein
MLPFLSIWQPYNSVNLCNLARKVATFSVGSSQEGLHLSLYSLSSGEGKIENFENPSFSKFWYRSRSLCPKGRAIGF